MTGDSTDDCEDCEGTVQIGQGAYEMRRCEECRQEAYSLEDKGVKLPPETPVWPLYLFILLTILFLGLSFWIQL